MTGNTRIDLFIKNNIKIFEKEADKIKKKYGDFCLLFGNFRKVNNASLKDENEYMKILIKKGTLKAKMSTIIKKIIC